MMKQGIGLTTPTIFVESFGNFAGVCFFCQCMKVCWTFGCNPQINSSMIIYFFPNDECVVVYCIDRILDLKLIVCF